MKLLIGIIGFLPLFFACNVDEEKNYFPFTSFLEKELKDIDSLPVAIFKYSERNNQLDTTLIDKDAFRKITTALLQLDLGESTITKNYTELVLEDTDIENIAISYSTEKKELPIKQLQLNIRSGTTLVKNFYVIRVDQLNDITIQRKILWTTGRGVTITSLYYKDNIVKDQLTEKYSWSIQ
jgi:hypothetical protein